jgi:hypothetical protein
MFSLLLALALTQTPTVTNACWVNNGKLDTYIIADPLKEPPGIIRQVTTGDASGFSLLPIASGNYVITVKDGEGIFVKVENGTCSIYDPHPSTTGTPGPQGPQGPQGIQGVQGVQGMPGSNGKDLVQVKDSILLMAADSIPPQGYTLIGKASLVLVNKSKLVLDIYKKN